MAYLINLLLVPIYYNILKGVRKKKAILQSNKTSNLAFIITVCIHALLFRALANPYNYPDGSTYAEGFYYIANMTFQEAILSINIFTHWGTGFLLLSWISSRVVSSFEFFTIVLSILTIVPIFWFYYKTSYKILGVAMLFLIYPMMYYMGFFVLRQHLSIAFILLSLYYLEERRKSIIFIFIAVSMHTSAIVFLPFYLWKKIDFGKAVGFKFITYSIIAFVVCRGLMSFVLSYLPKYEEILSDGSDNNFIPAIWFTIISLCIVKSGILRCDLTIVERNILSFFLYGTFIAVFSVGLSGMGRFTICFLYILPVVLSILSFYCKDKGLKQLCWCITVLITMRQLYYTLGTVNYDYSFLWEPSTYHEIL